MKIRLRLLIVFFIMLGQMRLIAQPEWMRKYNGAGVVRGMFAEPPMFYAPHAFWFWDDTIRDERFTASMAAEMIKQGLNPGYAHPRSSQDRGNPKYASLPYSQYLETPWFDSYGNAMQVAKDHGMTLGYCDEYDWPSGQAAGRVLKAHPELEAKYLDFRRVVIAAGAAVAFDSVDFAVAGKLVDGQIDASSLRLIGEGGRIRWRAPVGAGGAGAAATRGAGAPVTAAAAAASSGNWVVYTYQKKFHPGFDGGRVNYLDPNLMKVFIPIVHEQYAKRYGNDMGRTIPGVFVDNEGDYGWQMAWSEYLAQRYTALKKRDIRVWLPLLTEKDRAGVFMKARCDWFEVVSDVYISCYLSPLVSWLRQRNMYYISNLWEENLLFQTKAMGDFMRATRMASMPGTDCLLMSSQNVHDFKEVQSVAEFEDRPFMSEIMGVAGWQQTPADIKRTINSITSYGVNHVVPHGIYVNRDSTQTPYPADWFTENPYWPYLHYWTDFSRRAAFVTRQSKVVADVLLINPLESVWALAEKVFSEENTGDWDPRSVETEKVYSGAMQEMNVNNIDFLVADKYYLNNGVVGKNSRGARITIKGHDFSAMVLPPSCVISHAAAARVLEFARKGGVVILLGELPQGSPEVGMTDAAVIAQMKELLHLPGVVDLSHDADRLRSMVSALNARVAPQIKLEGAGRLYTAHRRIGSTDLYWLANNTDTVRHFTGWFRDGNGAAAIWNCETGEVKAVSSVNAGAAAGDVNAGTAAGDGVVKEGGYNKVALALQPYEGYYLVFNGGIAEGAATAWDGGATSLDAKWAISYVGQDTVYKTTARALFSGDKVIDEGKMAAALNDGDWKYNSFLLSGKAGAGRVQYYEEAKKRLAAADNYVYWRAAIPVGAKAMCFPANMAGSDVWIDGRKVRLSGSSLVLPAGARLLGFAGLVGGDALPTAPLRFVVGGVRDVALGSWYSYGLEEYTGYLDYETVVNASADGAKLGIDLGKVKYMAEVFVNDRSVGARLWPPFAFDISRELKKGSNTIRVRIGNIMLNKLRVSDNMGTLRSWGWLFPDFDQYDAGLMGPVKLISNK